MSTQSNTSNQNTSLGWRGLGGTMSALTLLISLIPLISVAVVVVIALSSSIGNLEDELLSTRQVMADEVVGASLQGEAEVTMNAIDAYMRERFQNAGALAGHLDLILPRIIARRRTVELARKPLACHSPREVKIASFTVGGLPNWQTFDPGVANVLAFAASGQDGNGYGAQ